MSKTVHRQGKERSIPQEAIEADLPLVMGRSRRSDLVVHEEDRAENFQRDPGITMDDLPPVSYEVERPDGLEVETIPGGRRLRVTYKGKRVLMLKWMPQGRCFNCIRTVVVRNETQSLEHLCDLDEAWSVCGDYGVTAEEFQAAFVKVPPQAKHKFENCPEERLDCKFDYVGNPRSSAMPDMHCRICDSVFSMSKGGQLTLKKKGEGCQHTTSDADVVEKPSRSSAPAHPVRRQQSTVDVVDSAIKHGFLERGQE